ncbi:MAG TPA: hypothetical protein VGO03_02225 [Acidimicrobiia bacterium]
MDAALSIRALTTPAEHAGAYTNDGELIGGAYGFVGRHRGRAVLHSHNPLVRRNAYLNLTKLGAAVVDGWYTVEAP